MSFLSRLFGVPNPKRPRADGVIDDRSQQTGAGLVSDFAIDRFTTALTRLPDPDEILRKAGMHRQDLRRMEFDDEISGALETRREAAITTQWRLDPEGEGEPNEQVKFVETELQRIFDDWMRGMWQAVPYGYSVSEAIYAPRDGNRVGIDRVGVKPMQWFEPLRDGRLVMQLPHMGTRVNCDTKFKFCLMRRSPTYQNPFGEALLSRLYWAWYFRHHGWKAWMQFVEKFGDPFVVGKSNHPKELVQALLGMGVKNVIGVGSEDDIQVLLQSGDSTFDRLDQRLTERIVKTLLGQTLTSGTGKDGGGSYALGKVHENVRQDKRLADVRMLQAGGQWLVNALWELNSFAGAAPKFIFADPADIAKERADRDVALKGAGIVRFKEQYVERVYGFEKGDIEIPDPAELEPQSQQLPGQQPPKGKTAVPPKEKKKLSQQLLAIVRRAREATMAEFGIDEHTPRVKGRREFTAEQEVIELLAASAMEHAPANPIAVEDIRAAILGAKDADDLEDRLAALIEKQDPKFAEMLERAIFAADVLGYIHAEEV
jgi:phage gp29-like protein